MNSMVKDKNMIIKEIVAIDAKEELKTMNSEDSLMKRLTFGELAKPRGLL